MTMVWINQELRKESDLGFVYKITRISDGKFYIGQKKFFRAHTKNPLKGRVNKRRGSKESDWESYYGSSQALLFDIKELGRHSFTREILYFCSTQWTLTYLELREQLVRDVFNARVRSYNGIINIRLSKPSLKILELLKNDESSLYDRLQEKKDRERLV